MKNSSKKNRIVVSLGTVFLCVCLSLGLYTLLRPAKDFSVRENRKLASFPRFTLSSLADGSYTKGLSSYFSDRFAGRDLWIQVNLGVKRASGQRENGSVYIGKNGQLYLFPEQPDSAGVKKNIEAINSFCKAFPKISQYVCIVPNAVSVQTKNLATSVPVYDQQKFLNSVSKRLKTAEFVDVTDALKAKEDGYIFYRTDHHWTSLGAFTAFGELAKAMKIDCSQMKYKQVTVADSFTGTLSSKSGSFPKPDSVEIYLPETETVYTVEYSGKNEKSTSIYSSQALKSNDKYTVFFGGNYPRIDIRTDSGTGRSLLVFKDSYFNCLAQFMWPYFDSITIIDPRYYYDYAGDIVRQEGITDVLYLYNADTFGSDSSLYSVLEPVGE